MGPASNDIDNFPYGKRVHYALQIARNECRDRFKWDRWECPKQVFQDILLHNPLDNNRETAFARALFSASIALVIAQDCSTGDHSECGCNRLNPGGQHLTPQQTDAGQTSSQQQQRSRARISPKTHSTTFGRNVAHHTERVLTDTEISNNNAWSSRGLSPSTMYDTQSQGNDQTNMGTASSVSSTSTIVPQPQTSSTQATKNTYRWSGCDDDIQFGFQISQKYLDAFHYSSSRTHTERLAHTISSHNDKAGRLAVKNTMEKKCKCHGVSGSCQLKTCWMRVSELTKVGAYLRRQYKSGAKIGATSSETSNVEAVDKELNKIHRNKLVFADSSPDYCYENRTLGTSGTLGRYCSRNKYDIEQQRETSLSERYSCDRLCTKCGYKVFTVETIVEKTCHCKFKFCCSVECRQCRKKEQIHRCVNYA